MGFRSARSVPGEVVDSASGDVDGYDRGRKLEDKATYSSCYAPFISMYFDQMGDVRACCQNTGGLLGSVRHQSLRDIWSGAAAEQLRGALEQRDFSVGCGFCEWQVGEGGTAPFARGFDRHPVRSPRPEWPAQMEFAMTNTCNLQCVMCNGDWSSSIRAQREHRPPLPAVYGDDFFEELSEFLPHLRQAKFLGGEPFLGKEPLRVMEMMIAGGARTPITVTTNATQWTPRVERICRELPVSPVISLDGITKATYEAIRIGADFDLVMANIGRLLSTVDNVNTHVSIAHCLMVPNWHEFRDLLRYAEDHGLDDVGINSVVFPRRLSLYQLPEHELRVVVREMERQDRAATVPLSRFRHVWEEQIEALSNRLRILGSQDAGRLDPWTIGVPSESSDLAGPADSALIDELADWAGAPPCLIRCDARRIEIDGAEVDRPILEVDDAFVTLVGAAPDGLVGRPMSAVFDELARALGRPSTPITRVSPERANHLTTVFGPVGDTAHEAQVLLVASGDEVHLLLAHRRRSRDATSEGRST